MRTITKLDIKYGILEDLLKDVYVGKKLTKDGLNLLNQRTRLTNALITPIEPDGKVDEFYEMALELYNLDWIHPRDFSDAFFTKHRLTHFLESHFDQMIYDQEGRLKYVYADGVGLYEVEDF